ncbi:MAG: putative Ig domain-containing protein, partial [Synergistaceae bacterium]|nr:putative Ig domain-containing protein [Synergistaceae bacterium]
SSLAGGTVKTAYKATLSATSATTLTWSIASGSLPTGLSLNSSSGVISGTPTKAGTFSFTVRATNSGGYVTKAFSITIKDTTVKPVITTSSLAGGTVKTAYKANLAASGTTPLTWSRVSGTLPTGLSLNTSSGLISGTPSKAGTFTFTVRATNSAGYSNKAFSITIKDAAVKPVITTSSLAGGTVKTAYKANLAASGTTPLTWSRVSGTLPTGLSLNSSSGVISGTPSKAGTFTFTVRATNAAGYSNKAFSVTIKEAVVKPVITTSSLAGGKVGTRYSASLAASGTKPLTWSIASGSLPTGLSLNRSTGAISGTPTKAGTFTFTVRAANSAGYSNKAFRITVQANAIKPNITTSSLAAGKLKKSYSARIAVTGTTPITWSFYSGSLPTGLSFNTSTGVISGTPTRAGSFSFRIKAANAGGQVIKSLSIKINN